MVDFLDFFSTAELITYTIAYSIYFVIKNTEIKFIGLRAN